MKIVPDRLYLSRVLSWLLPGLLVLSVAIACVSENDLTDDQRAYTLDRELMCPVCDGQTIDQSHAQIAEDMKLVVREKIAAGESNQEIRDYFVARYGEVVLASPDASGFNLIVWVMPVLLIGGGILAVFWVLKNMRQNAAAGASNAGNTTLAERQLEQYLDKVDADIGYRERSEEQAQPQSDPEHERGQG